MDEVKERLFRLLQLDKPVDELIRAITPLASAARVNALKFIGNPRLGLARMREFVANITEDFRLSLHSNVCALKRRRRKE